MTKIFLTGDTHSNYDIGKLTSIGFPQGKTLSKSDYVIVLGDFGLVWDQEDRITKLEEYWTKWLSDKPWTTLFIDGNHENFNRLNKLESIKMFGNEVGKVTESIYHLRRGNIYTIGNKTFLTIGGAQSIDRNTRIENASWWPEELISHQEQEKIFKTIERFPEVDYVLTHCCPLSIFKKMAGMLYKTEDPTYKILEEVLSRITFKHWYFGHFHIDERINEYFTALFNFIMEL